MRKRIQVGLLVLSVPLASVAQQQNTYAPGQAALGRDAYLQDCSACHGNNLEGNEAGPALAGSAFVARWSAHSLEDFIRITVDTMPVGRPAGLSDARYESIVAWILNRNGYPSSADPLRIAAAGNSAWMFSVPRGAVEDVSQQQVSSGGASVEWLHHRGTAGSLNYSALDLINRGNVGELEVAWRWRSDNFGRSPWPNLQTTPLMADGALFATAGDRRAVVAIDAATGETLWMYRLDEGERGENAPRKGPGRGVAFRRDDRGGTVYLLSPGYHLVALDATTGRPRVDFGATGIVDLKANLDQDVDLVSAPIGGSSPPIVVGDLVIVGSAFPGGGAPPTKEMPRGNVAAFDAVTGERRWVFHTIPQPGEYGHETWKDGSWRYTGNVGVWAPMSADLERGLLYLPVEAPTGDYYGGHRPGNNLYSQSIVCLDARTGERVWHFQTVHHGIWDYDLPAAPVLIDIQVDGNAIPAVAQITKQGFTFVFDRVTGEPVWPIEERAVPESDLPGELTAPTQPFPTLPEYFESPGVTEAHLNDLTPEIFAEAKRVVSQYTIGPVYTPPTEKTATNLGTILAPASVGGGNWQGAVADPESGYLYVSSTSSPGVLDMVSDPDRSNMRYITAYGEVEGPFGLPLLKPPWGRITAIDLNTGRIAWVVANGDTPPDIANHEKLQGVDLPRTGHDDRAGLLVTKSLLFAGEGAGLYVATQGGTKFRAHDKLTGEIIAEIDLGARQSGVPMTYAVNGQQFIVVAAGAPNEAGQLIALTVSR